MNQKLIINSEQVRSRAVHIIQGLPLDVVHQVCIKPYKRDRSAEQNALMWKWLTIIGAELGNTKDEQHDIYKLMFLVPIFIRDNQDYAEMWRTVSALGSYEAMLKREILKLTSTTQANVKQMSEYLDDIQRNAAELGIRLPAPEYK